MTPVIPQGQDIAAAIAKQFADDIPGRLVQRTAKLGATFGAEFGRSPEDGGFTKFDVSRSAGFGAGIQASIIAPKKFGDAPELFWGPIMQLGTFLEIESPVLRFITDAVLDPTNLILPGTGVLLNRGGQLARLITAATKGGKAGKTAEAAIKGVEKAIQVAAAAKKNTSLGEELLAAARTGKASRSEMKALTKRLLAADIDDESKRIIQLLRKNRKAFADLLTTADKLGPTANLDKSLFLRPTIAGRIRSGQVNPLFRIEKPFAMTRQLFGFGYRNTELFLPVTREIGGGIGRGLDAFRGKAIQSADEALLPELRTGVLGRFKDISTGSGTTKLNDLQDMLDFTTVVNEDASDSIVSLTGIGDELTEENLKRSFRAFKRGKSDATFNEFRERVINSELVRREELALELNARRAEKMDDFLGRVEGRGLAQDLPLADIAERQASFIAARDMFNIQTMKHDGMGLAHALEARVNFGSTMANQVSFGMNDIFGRLFKNRAQREPIMELFGRIIDTPDAFVVRDSKMFLRPDFSESKDSGAFLESLFNRHPNLREDLLKSGLPVEVWQMAQQADDVLKRLGKSLFEHEGIIGAFTENYLQRVFEFKDKALKGQPRAIRKWLEQELQDPKGVFSDMTRIARKAEGKLNFAEHRKALEAALVRMERAGLGTFRKDSVNLFTEYLHSSNKAIAANIMFKDLTQVAPRMSREAFERAGVNISEEAFDSIGNAGGILRKAAFDKLPKSAQRAYAKFSTALRFGFPTTRVATDLAVSRAIGGGDLDRFVTRQQRAELASELTGNRANTKLRAAIFQNSTGELRKPGSIERFFSDKEIKGFIERGQIPSRVKGSGRMNKRLRAEIRDRVSKQRGSQAALRTDIRKGLREAAPRRETVYVHKDIEPIVSETLRAFGDDNLIGGELVRKYGKLNATLKSTVLLADVFHYNVLSFTQMVMNPAKFGRVLGQGGPEAARNAAITAAAGGAAGATVGALQGQDAGGIATLGIAGALWTSSLLAARRNSLAIRRELMNPKHADTLGWMARGGFTGKPSDRAIGQVGRWLQQTTTRLRDGPAAGKLLISPLDGVRHVVDGFDQEMWEYLQVGSKQMYFDRVFWKEAGKLPSTLSNTERFEKMEALARETMQTANIALGGQRFSMLLGHPEWADKARLFLLSPDWTLSNLAGSAAVFMNMGLARSTVLGGAIGVAAELADAGWDPSKINGMGLAGGATIGALSSRWMNFVRRRMSTPGDLFAKEARRIYGSYLLGVYFMSNLLNMALSGHPLWDNPEGQKLAIDLGADDSQGRRQFLSLGKPGKEIFEAGGIIEQDKFPIPVFSVAARKLAILPRMGIQILQNDSGIGPVVQPDIGPFERVGQFSSFVLKSVTPIASQGPARVVSESFGDRPFGGPEVARGLIRGAGFPTRSGRRDRISLDAVASFLGTDISPPSLGAVGTR